MTAALQEIERRLRLLTHEEQLWLLERLAHRLRAETSPRPLGHDLDAMAADPAIQRELRRIEREFTTTESDGLAEL